MHKMFSFHTTYCKELNLKFDCATGENINHKFPIHVHNSLCIGLITKGKRHIILSGASYSIDKDEMFIINTYQPHEIKLCEPHDYIAITIKGLPGNTDFQNIITSTQCNKLFHQLYKSIINDKKNIADYWKELYGYMINNYELTNKRTDDELTIKDKALDYIKKNYKDAISIDEIASNCCMSTFYFSRLFKQYTGISPHNYLKLYRLSQSYSLLQKDYPIFDAAIETGFYDSSHFIKTFQSYMGTTPKEYQDSVLSK